MVTPYTHAWSIHTVKVNNETRIQINEYENPTTTSEVKSPTPSEEVGKSYIKKMALHALSSLKLKILKVKFS